MKINVRLVGLENFVRILADATEMPLVIMSLEFATALLDTMAGSVTEFACLVSTVTGVKKNANVEIIRVIQSLEFVFAHLDLLDPSAEKSAQMVNTDQDAFIVVAVKMEEPAILYRVNAPVPHSSPVPLVINAKDPSQFQKMKKQKKMA